MSAETSELVQRTKRRGTALSCAECRRSVSVNIPWTSDNKADSAHASQAQIEVSVCPCGLLQFIAELFGQM